MAIETAALSIIDRVIQLLTLRERNRERFFSNFIEPLYRDAEPVAKDYMGLLAELAHKIQEKTPEDVIVWLEERRAAYRPVRMKLRALLQDPSYRDLSPSGEPTPLQRFTFGIWSLMMGGTSLVSGGKDEVGWVRLPEYGYEGHTILVLLERIRPASEGSELSEEDKDYFLGIVRDQQLAIVRAWEDVVKGYAELKRQHL